MVTETPGVYHPASPQDGTPRSCGRFQIWQGLLKIFLCRKQLKRGWQQWGWMFFEGKCEVYDFLWMLMLVVFCGTGSGLWLRFVVHGCRTGGWMGSVHGRNSARGMHKALLIVGVNYTYSRVFSIDCITRYVACSKVSCGLWLLFCLPNILVSLHALIKHIRSNDFTI